MGGGQALWERVIEFVAAAVTGYLFVTRYFSSNTSFMMHVFAFWPAYIAISYFVHGEGLLVSWGFKCSWAHLRRSFVWPTCFFVFTLIVHLIVVPLLGLP